MYMEVDLDSSPISVLAGFRGPIVAARIAYPEVLHVEVRDAHGETWRLATQDASWSPSDPASLRGRAILESAIDEITGELRCELSGGPALTVTPAPQMTADDPPNWELTTPRGLTLEFGPGTRWQIIDEASP